MSEVLQFSHQKYQKAEGSFLLTPKYQLASLPADDFKETRISLDEERTQ